MSTLYFFNPENDLALASNSQFFTPPSAAIHLQRSGAALMAWLGKSNDFFVGRQLDEDWLKHLSSYFNIVFPSLFNVGESIDTCQPWGWSLYTRRQFLNAGIDASLLPDENTIELSRQLGHRRLTIKIHEWLASHKLPYTLPQIPSECIEIKEIENRLKSGEALYIKSPWSGSGRGIIDSKNAPIHQVIRMANGVIGHQGSVLVEKSLHKVQDFAILYDMIDGKSVFIGYSLFFNSGYSAYSGNTLSEDNSIKRYLSQYVPEEWLTATQEAVGKALENIIEKTYSGPVGVDMLIYDDYDYYKIAPCIEVNLRMTMGRVAHHIYENYIMPGSTGEFRLEMLTPDRQIQLSKLVNSISIDNHRLKKGTIPLTPPAENRFCFTMTVD